jgi:hypothetical protein
MGTVVLKAGAEIGYLTPDDLAKSNSEMKDFFKELTRGQEGETISHSAAPFLTDGSGNTAYLAYGGGRVYRVPVGFDAFLTRISIDYEGSNTTSPQSCDVRVVADAVTPAALRLINNQLPAIWDGSKSHAPLFRGGQLAIVALQGGPASTNISCTLQVVLVPRRQRVTSDDLSGV